jgi:hypothetical protein
VSSNLILGSIAVGVRDLLPGIGGEWGLPVAANGRFLFVKYVETFYKISCDLLLAYAFSIFSISEICYEI